MDRFQSMQLFVRIVELGSFSLAAVALDVPRATASHAIKALEARLGARLLERTTRHVQPTLDGKAFYERCVQILGELDDAESSFRHVASNPRGVLRLDLHGTHATQIVLPRIDAFCARYPGIELVITSGDRLVDLIREGVDCVVRAGEARDASLVAKRLAVMPQVVCASPAYLAQFGVPATPDELNGHQAVGFFVSGSDSRYPVELVVDGKVRAFTMKSCVTVNDAENYVICARRGCGLIQLPRHHVEEDLRAGRLVQVLSEWQSPGMPVSVMYPHRRQLSLRVRVFIEWVSGVYRERFGELAG